MAIYFQALLGGVVVVVSWWSAFSIRDAGESLLSGSPPANAKRGNTVAVSSEDIILKLKLLRLCGWMSTCLTFFSLFISKDLALWAVTWGFGTTFYAFSSARLLAEGFGPMLSDLRILEFDREI